MRRDKFEKKRIARLRLLLNVADLALWFASQTQPKRTDRFETPAAHINPPRTKAIVRRCRQAQIGQLADGLMVPASPAYQRCVADSFDVPEREKRDPRLRWMLESAETRRRLAESGCPMAFEHPWTDSGALLRGLAGTPRQKDILDIAFLSHSHRLNLHPGSDEAKEAARSSVPGGLGLVVDVSQSVERHPWSYERLHTVTTSTRAYSFSLERVLAAEELLMMHGWPREIAEAPHTIGRAAMRDLVGETMALPTVAAAMAALLVAAYE